MLPLFGRAHYYPEIVSIFVFMSVCASKVRDSLYKMQDVKRLRVLLSDVLRPCVLRELVFVELFCHALE